MKKFMVISIDAGDDFGVMGDDNTVFVLENDFDSLEESKELFEERKEHLSNVYLVEILKQNEHI